MVSFMGMRSKEEYNEEDLARINEAVNSGIHSIERKPFRFRCIACMLSQYCSPISVGDNIGGGRVHVVV